MVRTITGTSNNDALLGTNDADEILGLGGNDTIVALGGNDTVRGGDGDDGIIAGSGDDLVYGDAGVDILIGGTGNDSLYGGSDNDTITGEDGDDQLFGDDGNDTLIGDLTSGGFGNDILKGGKGDDRLFAGDGDDQLSGGEGKDQLNGDIGNDSLEGGNGDDIVFGGIGDDVVKGNNGADVVIGGGGNDSLAGGIGSDRLIGVDPFLPNLNYGQGEIDSLTGGQNDDVFVLGDVIDNANVVYYNDGNGKSQGTKDYALIKDFGLVNNSFNRGVDKIQLSGSSSDYFLGSSPIGLPSGTAIFFNDSVTKELIGILQGISLPKVSLSDANQFSFVKSPLAIGNLDKTPIVRSGTLTGASPSDVFVFNNTTASNINIALTNISAGDDIDVQLFRDDGDGIFEPTSGDIYIASGPRPSNQDDSINVAEQPKGTYFLEVGRFDLGSVGDASYSLSLSNTDPSNLLPIEFQVGSLSSSQTFIGNVGNSDTADVYAFSLDKFEGTNISLKPGGGNADIRLIADSNGNDIVDAGEVVDSSKKLGTQKDTIQVNDPGKYLLQVYQTDADAVKYNLEFDYFTKPGAVPTIGEKTDSINLGNLNATPVAKNNTLSEAEPSDIYVFNTKSTGNINLALTNISDGDDANLRLFRDDGDGSFEPTSDDVFISTAVRRTNVDDSINVSELVAGTYFAEVSRGDDSLGDVSYKLSLSTANPSNLLLNEIPLGNLSSSFVVNANISNNDASDIFAFSLDKSESAKISLKPVDGNVDIRLIADGNKNGIIDAKDVLVSSTFLGTKTDTVQVDTAGSYFLQAYQVNGDPTNYTLSFDYFTA
ncbi:MAG: pre-peptidase C-terminal domain-containing protein [Desmonostoc vinosum HA7617-LM4]|nr:pre-peptidase C-terminal domain-containing protein [Desmonostoc vinosum HA7617-LM4]